MRVYLDAWCLCRPFDDQTVDRNRLEAEAVVAILRHVHEGEWSMIASDAIRFEIERIGDADKREFAAGFLALTSECIAVGRQELDRMGKLGRSGFDPMDALHIACAETGRCDVLLTTDDDLLRKARRHTSSLTVRVENPLDWIQEQFDHGDDGMTLNEIRSKGLAVLVKELGPVGYVRFIQEFQVGRGDYTGERRQRLGGVTADHLKAALFNHSLQTDQAP